MVSDRVHQVGLPEADAAVDEERVVAFAGTLRHRLADGVRELIAAPDDEGIERVVRAKIALVASGERGARAKFPRRRGGLLGSHVERDADRALGDRPDRALDQVAVVLVEPINVELVRNLEHERRAVELQRTEILEPCLVGLARNAPSNLLKRLFPKISDHHRLHHQIVPNTFPNCEHHLHVLSTHLSTSLSPKRWRRNGCLFDPLRPQTNGPVAA